MRFVFKMIVFPFWLITAFLALMLLILLVAEFGCFLLITAGIVIVEAVEWFSGWVAEL